MVSKKTRNEEISLEFTDEEKKYLRHLIKNNYYTKMYCF